MSRLQFCPVLMRLYVDWLQRAAVTSCFSMQCVCLDALVGLVANPGERPMLRTKEDKEGQLTLEEVTLAANMSDPGQQPCKTKARE